MQYNGQHICHRPIAAMLINMQDSYLNTLFPLTKMELLQQQRRILEYCVQHDHPIVAVQRYRQNSEEATDYLRPLICKSPRHLFIQNVEENALSGLNGDRAIRQLHDWNIERILLMGAYASIQVPKTGCYAEEKGFSVVTSPTLIGDHPYHKRFKTLPDCLESYSAQGISIIEDTEHTIKHISMSANGRKGILQRILSI